MPKPKGFTKGERIKILQALQQFDLIHYSKGRKALREGVKTLNIVGKLKVDLSFTKPIVLEVSIK